MKPQPGKDYPGKAETRDPTQALMQILRRIDRGDDLRVLGSEAQRLIHRIRPRDLAEAQRRLVHSGTSPQEAGQLSVAFPLMGLFQGGRVRLADRLPADHVLRIILAEHELMRCFLADLDTLVGRIEQLDRLTDTSTEFMHLSHVAEHLYGMLEHFEREDDVLFPELRKRGWTVFSDTPRQAHERIRNEIDSLLRLLGTFRAERFAAFKRHLGLLSRNMIRTILDHLDQEDNLLFPVALEAVPDAAAWERIKALCDAIGYCGMHV